MNRNSGFTLIEILATMTMGSGLMLLAIGMVHQMMKLSTETHAIADEHRTVSRLARQFRNDTHLAESFLQTEPTAIALKLSNETTVAYSINLNEVVRNEMGGEQSIRREQYRLPADFSVRIKSQNEPQRLVLTISRDSEFRAASPRVEREISAVVGRLQIFEDDPNKKVVAEDSL